MALSEFIRGHSGVEFGILATDISTRVLAHGVRGIYDISRITDVPSALRARYLLRDRAGSRVRIIPELRKKVGLHRLNLMDADYRVRTMFDVIFFRNVMIYFDRETQEAVINKLCRNLKPGGLLFVGHSESISGFSSPITQVDQAVFQKHR
jgi:chemotaxis protein methyltransferase CheR